MLAVMVWLKPVQRMIGISGRQRRSSRAKSFTGHHRHGLICDHHIELPWRRLECLQGLDTTGVHRSIIAKTHEHLGSHVCQGRLVIDKQDAPVALRDGGFFQVPQGMA